ncbi:hypothetical protein Tco_0454630, partial [Tanacetum coccineum]
SSMSDLEDSTVTYTEIPSPYEDLSDVGSPGVEGPIFQDPPSPDYVPGPEEPEQAPPSPIYPMPAADSPTHRSPGYILESDPEEDPGEDDEEDPADYPADRGDDDDDDDDTEEEHLAPTDPAAVAYSADQDPYLAYRAVSYTPGLDSESGRVSAAGTARQDRPFLKRTCLLIVEEARVSRPLGHSRWMLTIRLLKADHRRQRQLVEALKIVKSLKTQMIELQRQQGPAKDPVEPELPEEASSSS